MERTDEIEEAPLEPEWEWEPTEEKGEESAAMEEPLTEAVPSGEIAPYDPLQHYLMEIRRYPFLSREEEVRLARSYLEEGNLEAVSRLVLSNLRLVVHIARDYRNIHLPLMDMIQEGNIGLMQAAKKFDPNRGVRLSTYAAWWIRAYILRYILNNWRQVKIGTTQAQRKLFFNLRKEKERLEALGYEVGPKLLAHHLNVKEQDVVEMEQRLGSSDLSLSTPRLEGGDKTLEDYLPSGELPLDERLAREEVHDLLLRKVAEFAETLPPRDREILNERVLSDNPKSLAEIGRLYGVSRERARQIEERLLKRLREFLKEEIRDDGVFDHPP